MNIVTLSFPFFWFCFFTFFLFHVLPDSLVLFAHTYIYLSHSVCYVFVFRLYVSLCARKVIIFGCTLTVCRMNLIILSKFSHCFPSIITLFAMNARKYTLYDICVYMSTWQHEHNTHFHTLIVCLAFVHKPCRR